MSTTMSIQPLQPPLLPGDIGGGSKPHNLSEASNQFEAIFWRSVLKQTRQAQDVLFADDEDNFLTSKEQKIMQGFYDDNLAQTLASQHSSGFANLLIKQLSQQK